jgi:hypothetical protein
MRGGHAAHPLRYGLVIVLFSLALAVARFLVQGDIGLDLGDEGQLWYVTTRTALGDVPLRDIRSYDPGRYYWGAAWFKLLGPCIISLRIGTTFIQALGLIFGRPHYPTRRPSLVAPGAPRRSPACLVSS